MSAEPPANAKPNRLAREKSPYLLEHAYNPVDWFPWGEEAFEKARNEDKPIFLSIGYSSCHWCHVFRRESLENPKIAAMLNKNFVSIKVDREERPDVDEIYMKAVVSMTGSGGWPLNVFLTPSLEPFYGGTYFPPESRSDLPGFTDVLDKVAEVWESDRKEIVQSAKEIRGALKELYSQGLQTGESTKKLDDSLFDLCFSELASSFDQSFGGFGGAPKFPSPSTLLFLLRYFKLGEAQTGNGSKAPLLMARKTLDHMTNGGIHDHVGGGFHRYSTDREWLVPHFEKMLYDNALISLALIETYLATKDESYRKTTEDTLDWVLREMTSSSGGGGFFSAQDADSPEGEGSYYVWSRADVIEALTTSDRWDRETLERDAGLICNYFGITERGNFEEKEDKSILTTSPERLSKLIEEGLLPRDELESVLRRGKEAMLDYRGRSRQKPLTDDKILTSWNGLMISAMSKAFQAFGEGKYLTAAQKSADFILRNMSENGSKKLLHRFREGEAKGEGILEDYSFFVNGLIDLYESSFDLRYLRTAIELSETMIGEFYDQKSDGGFFATSSGVQNLIVRVKDAYDGALPSANSIASLSLFRLAEITGRKDFDKKAQDTIGFFSSKMENQPSSFAFMLLSLMFKLGRPKEVVLSGERISPQFSAMLQALRSEYLPNAVIVYAEAEAQSLSPLVEGRVGQQGSPPIAFVCSGNVCRLPSTSPEELLTALKN